MISKSKFLIVYALLAIAALYIHLHADIAVPANKPFSAFPVDNKDWRMTSQVEFSEDMLNVLKPTDYLSREYAGPDGQRVYLYIGYHGGGKDSRGIHSPKHCLPGSGWYEVASGKTTVNVTGGKVNMVKAVYRKGEDSLLILYWFQVKDKSLSDEYSLKLAEIMNSVAYRRRDSTFIKISVPFEADEKKAMTTAASFLHDFYPVIQEYLPDG